MERKKEGRKEGLKEERKQRGRELQHASATSTKSELACCAYNICKL